MRYVCDVHRINKCSVTISLDVGCRDKLGTVADIVLYTILSTTLLLGERRTADDIKLCYQIGMLRTCGACPPTDTCCPMLLSA